MNEWENGRMKEKIGFIYIYINTFLFLASIFSYHIMMNRKVYSLEG